MSSPQIKEKIRDYCELYQLENDENYDEDEDLIVYWEVSFCNKATLPKLPKLPKLISAISHR